jgi:hypothetical protein
MEGDAGPRDKPERLFMGRSEGTAPAASVTMPTTSRTGKPRLVITPD